MVGADEEMSVTVVRWKIGEERLKKDLEGACAAQPEGTSEGTPEGKSQGVEEDIDPNVKREEVKKEKKTPDFLALMLERVIDTILLEEVALLGTKMNRYRGVLAQGIWKHRMIVPEVASTARGR